MKLFLRSILVLAFASFSPLAFGQPIPDAWLNTHNAGQDQTFDNNLNWTTGTANVTPGPNNLVVVLPGFLPQPNPAITVNTGGAPTITINTVNPQTVDWMVVSAEFPSAFTGNPQFVSGGALNLNFNSGSTLTINANLGTSAGTALEVLGGATLNFTGNLTTTGDVDVGEEQSVVTPAAGKLIGPGTLNLGAGTVNLDSTTSTFNVGAGQLGTVVQNSGSTVITGQNNTSGEPGLFIQSGSYTVNAGAVLDIGNQVTPASGFYNVTIGSGVAAMNIAGGTLNAMNPNTTITIGSVGNSTFTQSGASSVNVGGSGSQIFIGESGATGTYTLSGGALNIGANNTDLDELSVGTDSGATGNFTQTGGTVEVGANSPAFVGDSGTGTYTISGSSAVTADFAGGLTVGSQGGSVGTFTQTGGLVTVESLMIVGNGGSGTYSLTGGELDANSTLSIGAGGGTGIFNYGGTGNLVLSSGITIGATGTFNQNASISLTNAVTQGVNVASGGAYFLNSGTLTTGGSVFTGAGNLNFAGGTVVITGTTWLDPLNSTITGTSTIDTTAASATLSGNLVGTGTLNIIGGNTVELSGANSGSWGATIKGDSTLTADTAASLSTNGSYQIGSGSTLNINNTTTQSFAGSISNITDSADPSGTAQLNTGTGKLILSGMVNLDVTTATTIGAGGELEVDKGTISNINGATGNGADTFDVGNGTSTGTVMLRGNNILPNVFVNSGSTLLAANITGSVTNGGTLGSFGTNSVPATLTIGGAGSNLTSTGTLLIHTNGVVTDEITGLTTANLSGIVKVIGTGAVTNAVIVNTTGGLTATIGTAPGDLSSTSTALLTTTLSENADQLLLTSVQHTLGSFAKTPNESAVASVLDPIINAGGPFNPNFNRLLNGLNNLPAGSIPYALESLTPDTLQYSRIISFEGSTFLVQRMNGVDNDLRAGYGGLDTNAISVASVGFDSGLGRSLKSLLASDSPAFHSTAPNGVNYYPAGTGGTSDSGSVSAPESSPMPGWEPSSQVITDTPNPYMANQHPEGPESPAFSEFISGDLVLADINTDLNALNAPSAKGSYKAADATAGVAYRFTSNFSAGILFDYDHTDAKTDAHGSQMEVNTYQPGLFATYFNHGFYANALFIFGYNEYNNTRQIQFLGDAAQSTPSGDQFIGDLDFGYDFHPDKNWVVGPTVGVTYTQLNIDSFTETGAPGANLAVNSQQAESLRSRLGGHVIFQADTGSLLLQPNITAVWQHEYLDNASGITSTFSDFNSNPFTINTTSPSRDSALLGVGLTATFNSSFSLYLNYMADVGADDYFAQSVMGGFKARF